MEESREILTHRRVSERGEWNGGMVLSGLLVRLMLWTGGVGTSKL